MYKKLFIPGPTHVREEILQAQTAPMIGHRAKEYSNLQGEVRPKLQQLLYTQQPVLIFASSGTGVMEGSIRQAVRPGKRALVTVCGAFSKRWFEVSEGNGIPTDKIEVEWGLGFRPEQVVEALGQGDYDALTLTLNETSTGIQNPVAEIAAAVRAAYPEIVILVDAVSAMAGAKIEFDAWDIDCVLASSQKCFALPPGLAVAAVSERMLKRAGEVPGRGYYFDFLDNLKYWKKDQTPATPAISLIYALNKQLDDIMAEGLENRWARHLEMAGIVQAWGRKYWKLFAADEFLSPTVTTIANTRGISVSDLNKALAERGAMISNGYGDLKEKTFRIATMGDLTVADINWLLGEINDILGLA
ncbi:MAG: alanine--glyoxylate aminotransferase family protein [Anaerolineae bacterium]|jgi:aspartate aminotransferase-like enzyme|nr:alanine--glyoxylate aminotransferase family protein [Anaerolineae bacterium]